MIIIIEVKAMKDINLKQKGGTCSHNTQIIEQNNYHGLGYEETKALCQDLIKAELDIYKDESLKIARKRHKSLMNNILERLEREKMNDQFILEEFKNPDLQYVYINAQKSYIRTGIKKLEDMLSDLIVNRIKEKNRSLLQIVLNESINIIPMLLPEQMDILALCFLLKHTSIEDDLSLKSFKTYAKTLILPHIKNEMKKESFYQHIEYSGCGQISLGESSLEGILSTTFKGFFLKGIDMKEIEQLQLKYPDCFIQSLYDDSLWQINAFNDIVLENMLSKFDIKEDKNLIRDFYNENLMHDKDIKDRVIEIVPEMSKLFEVWSDSKLKNLQLTSVGIVIGATYSKQISGMDYDLNIWI